MSKVNDRLTARYKRQARVRKRVQGTSERPRLCVFRSLSHIYAQIIDDERGTTLLALSSLSPELKDGLLKMKKIEAAKALGKAVAEAAKSKGLSRVIFDRNGFLYHGRVKAMADGAREGGLEF